MSMEQIRDNRKPVMLTIRDNIINCHFNSLVQILKSL